MDFCGITRLFEVQKKFLHHLALGTWCPRASFSAAPQRWALPFPALCICYALNVLVNSFANTCNTFIRLFNTVLFNYREKIVSSDDLLEWLRPFCSDDSLAVKPRIRVLQILEQAFHLSDEDSKLLVYFRTQAVLRVCWPETKVLILIAINGSIRLVLYTH